MSAVDLELARWLKEGVRFAEAADAAVAARWGALARTTEIRSCLALSAGAAAEGARQVAFLGGPLVEDVHLVSGLHAGLIGQAVTLTGDDLGYAGGAVGLVIGARELDEVEMTELTVLRRLG